MNKIAFLFPGQASQYVGMGKETFEKFSKAKQIFNEANEVLGFDLKKLCFESDMNELTKTENAQPAILTVSYIAFNMYMDMFNIEPAFLAGHSLGEYSALVSSGALSFSDALKIVRKRGQFMQEAAAEGVGSMAAIGGLDSDLIQEICFDSSNEDEVVVISNYNAPSQIVISGHKEAVEKASAKLEKLKGIVMPLKVSAPFHSPLMKPAADKLKNELMKCKYQELKYPVIANINAKPYENHRSIITNLTEQLEKPVYWADTMKYLLNNDVNMAIELGPKTVLKNLMKKNTDKIKVYSSDVIKDMESFKKQATEASVEKENLPNVITRCLAIAVCTRNRNWNNDEYNKGVIEPYKKIQEMQDELDKNVNKPTVEQMKEALELLKTIFITKKTPIEEQVDRFNQIFDETGTGDIFRDFKVSED